MLSFARSTTPPPAPPFFGSPSRGGAIAFLLFALVSLAPGTLEARVERTDDGDTPAAEGKNLEYEFLDLKQEEVELSKAGEFERAARACERLIELAKLLHPEAPWACQDYIDRLESHSRAATLDEEGRAAAVRAIEIHDEWLERWNEGDFLAAETLLVEQLEIHRRLYGDRSKRTTFTLHLLANSIQKQGRVAEAEILQRHVMDLQHENWGTHHPGVLATTVNIGELIKKQGKPREARDLLRAAVPVSVELLGETHDITIALRINLIGAFLDLDELEPAAEILTALAEHGPEAEWLKLYVLDAIAEHAILAEHTDSIEKIENAYRESANPETGLGPHHPDTLHRRLEWARAEAKAGKPDTRQSLEGCVALFAEVLGDEHLDTIEARRILGIFLHRNGDTPAAIAALLEAERGHEQARLRVQSDALSRAHYDARRSPSATLAACAASAGDHRLAWRALEASFGRGLLDSWEHRWSRPLTRDERRKQVELSVGLQRLDEQIQALRQRGKTAEETEELRRSRARLVTRVLEFERGLATRYDFEGPERVSIESVPPELPAGTVFVAWHHQEELDENWAFVLVRGRDPLVVELPSLDARAVAKLRSIVSTRPRAPEVAGNPSPPRGRGPGISRRASSWSVTEEKDFEQLRETLRVALWDPVVAAIASDDEPAISEVIVLPSPALSGLPATMIFGPTSIGGATIRSVPSVTFHERLRTRPARAPGGALLAIADAEQDLKQGSLPYSRREVDALDRLFRKHSAAVVSPAAGPDSADSGASKEKGGSEIIPGTQPSGPPTSLVLSGAEASEERLLALCENPGLERFGYLHFATHAVIDGVQPLRSALILRSEGQSNPIAKVVGETSPVDGRVTAEQIRRTWHLDADLVVLSACRSGMGENLGGEGFLGFSQALLSSGARTLMLSLWRVDDRATALLMGRFYHELFEEGRSKGGALRAAQEWLRAIPAGWTADLDRLPLEEIVAREAPEAPTRDAPYRHPYYWAAFILVGAE